MNKPEQIPCDKCNTTAFEISDGVLKIIHRHHGEHHVTVKRLDTLFSVWYGKSNLEVKEPKVSSP